MKIRSYFFAAYIVVFLSLLSSSVMGQVEAPITNAITFIGAESVASEAKRTVFAVQSRRVNDKGNIKFTTVGSGFFVAIASSTNYPLSLFGITCNHVVNGIPASEVFVGLDTTNGYQRIACNVFYKDATNDIAIIVPKKDGILSAVGDYIDAEKMGIKNIAFATNTFDDGGSIVEGRGVLIIGYPLALGLIGNKNYPIVRFGIIAQNAEEKTFVIDGMASHGNSGSPVVGLSACSQNLLGMVQSFVGDSIMLNDEAGQLAASLPYNSGLANAVKASVILEDLHKAIGNKGVRDEY